MNACKLDLLLILFRRIGVYAVAIVQGFSIQNSFLFLVDFAHNNALKEQKWQNQQYIVEDIDYTSIEHSVECFFFVFIAPIFFQVLYFVSILVLFIFT